MKKQQNTTISVIQLFQQFPNNDVARQHIEKVRWKGNSVCPACGCNDNIYARTGNRVGYY